MHLAAVHKNRFSFVNAADLQQIVCRDDPYPSVVAFSAADRLLGPGSWAAGVVMPVSDMEASHTGLTGACRRRIRGRILCIWKALRVRIRA
jgi:hypothetical protein